MTLHWVTLAGVLSLAACSSATDVSRQMRPQSVVLLITPKLFPDFAKPEAAILSFFTHYAPLTSQSAETIVVFAVGNSDHILNYRGRAYWKDTVEWARTTDGKIVSNRTLDYEQIDGIVRALRNSPAFVGRTLKVFEHIDSGSEFTPSNIFKYVVHPECTSNEWGMYDVRARLQRDTFRYATAASGVPEGMLCGEFLINQATIFVHDLNVDGIMFDNQLGTRGRWTPSNGPGYSPFEADGIDRFLSYANRSLAPKTIMWFDSYNNTQIERDIFSFPAGGYRYFDYIIMSGFCVVLRSNSQYEENIQSKMLLGGGAHILASLDYVDPWYTYNSMNDYAACSQDLESFAITHKYDVDGIMFFAHDEMGRLVPRPRIEAFATHFFSQP